MPDYEELRRVANKLYGGGMTDREKARDLRAVWMARSPFSDCEFKVWDAVAAKARELFGGPSHEERAVIEAAEACPNIWYTDPEGEPAMPKEYRAVLVAVRALRASRQPKPRHEAKADRCVYRRTPMGTLEVVAQCFNVEDAERIARLLEADKP